MAAPAPSRSTAEATLARQFAALKALAATPGRAAAFARFAASGLPTRRIEAWHYTDLRAAMTDAAPLAPAPDGAAIEAARALLAAHDKIGVARLVTVNGRFAPELGDAPPDGAAVAGREARATEARDAMASLVEAMSPDSLTVEIAAGAEIAGPIEIVHLAVGEGAFSLYSWTEIALGAGARATVVETFLGATPAVQRHAATTVRLARGGWLKHVAAIGDEAELHLESQLIDLEAEAELNAFGFVSGGALNRRQIFARLAGADAKIALGGLALIEGTRRADTTLEVVHVAPRGFSREFYRAIVADEAVGVFQGKIMVAPGAQKTDGAMKSQAVLLSPQAQMNAKPELEIFADDVICGHGATVASIDPEMIFYLQSRGIPKEEAEAMLLDAFGAEAIAKVDDDALAEGLRARLAAWLAGRNLRTEANA
ncbi:iron-regulated ABC transporter permease protein SufD [Roseiarcus fermentans]|uniref:Iron-regulated ABC transporter permease protein SufD n=1 Tax=Roseiarcus fermentans TaxID=1473586 RepID=A0A366FMN0_9HYPH|nr:SufD family Fe-S cluster assembly protein [Roseiarcus fermentans]RBP15831.1 iron-regulated ABC transporter permease protein SufD [Roseiarcus fermentans]